MGEERVGEEPLGALNVLLLGALELRAMGRW